MKLRDQEKLEQSNQNSGLIKEMLLTNSQFIPSSPHGLLPRARPQAPGDILTTNPSNWHTCIHSASVLCTPQKNPLLCYGQVPAHTPEDSEYKLFQAAEKHTQKASQLWNWNKIHRLEHFGVLPKGKQTGSSKILSLCRIKGRPKREQEVWSRHVHR